MNYWEEKESELALNTRMGRGEKKVEKRLL